MELNGSRRDAVGSARVEVDPMQAPAPSPVRYSVDVVDPRSDRSATGSRSESICVLAEKRAAPS